MLCLVRQWIPSFVRLRWFFVPVYRAATCSVLVLPEVFRIIGFYGDDFTFVFVFYAELGSTADTCTASVYGACEACVSVFSAQLGSTADTCGSSFYEAFLEEFHTFFYVMVFDVLSFRRGRSPWSCFLADHRDFPVAVRFQVSMPLLCRSCRFMSPSWRSGSSHGPDCSSDLLLPQLLYAVADVPVVQVEQVHFSRRGAVAAPMVQTVRRTFCFRGCCTRLSMPLLCRSSRFTSPSWRRGRFHGPDCPSDHFLPQ